MLFAPAGAYLDSFVILVIGSGCQLSGGLSTRILSYKVSCRIPEAVPTSLFLLKRICSKDFER